MAPRVLRGRPIGDDRCAGTQGHRMKRRSAVRGTRLVATSNQVDRGAPVAARRVAEYWCGADHLTSAVFAADVEPPEEWACRVCGRPSTPERGTASLVTRPRFFPRTPYEFLMMRRTVEDGERILAEALAAMRKGTYPTQRRQPRSHG